MNDILDKIEKKVSDYKRQNEKMWHDLYDYSDETINVILRAFRNGCMAGVNIKPKTTRKRKTTAKKK